MSTQDPAAFAAQGPMQGAPPQDITTRLQEREFLQFRYEQAMSLAIQNVKQHLAAQIMAGQQELAEDAYPQDPTSQADWMAGTRTGMADQTLTPERVQRRIMGAPDEVQQELIGQQEAQGFEQSVRKAGEFVGRRQGALSSQKGGVDASFGRGFLEAVTMAKGDDRVLYDFAQKYSEGQMPMGTPFPGVEEKGGETIVKPGGHETLLSKERQRDVFYESAKKGYEEEVRKSDWMGSQIAKKAGGLAGIVMGPGGAALGAGKAIATGAAKGAAAILGKQLAPRAAVALGWAGATAAGGAFETAHPLGGDDKQVLDRVRKDKGDEVADKVEGQLHKLRFLQGVVTWGTIEAMGIPLGAVGTAGGQALPGLTAGLKRVAAGAATGAALEPASAVGEYLTYDEYKAVMGKDPQLKTGLARAFKVQLDPAASKGEKVEAWKQAVAHMGVDAAMFGALHAAQAVSMVLPPSQKTEGREVVSILQKEARAELDEKTDLPREAINRIVPSPEEKPVEVPLARPGLGGTAGRTVVTIGGKTKVIDNRGIDLTERIKPAEVVKDAERRATEATEARKEAELEEPASLIEAQTGVKGVQGVIDSIEDRLVKLYPQAERQHLEHTAVELAKRGVKAEELTDDSAVRAAAKRTGAFERRTEKAAPPAPRLAEPVRRETIAEERRWIAEKQAEAEAEGRPEIANELQEYSKRFEDESRGEGFVPDPTRRPASSDELGKGPGSTVRKALQEDVTEKTILKRLKKQHGLEAGDARKLILKERGARELREQQARSYEEGEGLSAQQAKDLQGGLEPGTRFRFRDLFEGRELTVTKNVAGGPVEVSDGDRRVTLIGPEFQRLDPQSIRKPEAAPAVALPAKPEAPAPTLAARPEALEVPWTVKDKGKTYPVRVNREGDSMYAAVRMGKGDRQVFQGKDLADIQSQAEAWAKRRGVELAVASDVGKVAGEAAEAVKVRQAHEAAAAEAERSKAQETREKAEQERTPQGVDALEQKLRKLVGTLKLDPEQPRIMETVTDKKTGESYERPVFGGLARGKEPQAARDAARDRFIKEAKKAGLEIRFEGNEIQVFDKANPEAGFVNVGAWIHGASDLALGPPRGLKDPRGRESEKQLHSVFLGNRPWAKFKDMTDRFLGTTLNVGHAISGRIRNLIMTTKNRRDEIKRGIVRRVEPAMREVPREEDGNTLAFNWFNRHEAEDIAAVREWAKENKRDHDKMESGLSVIRDEHRTMRLEMNRNNEAYLSARSQFRMARKALRREGLSAKQKAGLQEAVNALGKRIVELRNAGHEEYIHRVFDPKTTEAYGGKVRKIVERTDVVPRKRVHRAMLPRTGAEGYQTDVFVSVDRYFMGMVDAIESTKTLRQLDPLVNGKPRHIGNKYQDKGGAWIDPLDLKKPGEQFFLGESVGGHDQPKGEAAQRKWKAQILEWVKWDKEAGIATLRRFDTQELVHLPENLARSLYRKEGGLLALARKRGSTEWRADLIEKVIDRELMGRWVDRDPFDAVMSKLTAYVRWFHTNTILGAALGNVTKTPIKAFALGHWAGMSDAGVAAYSDAMIRYVRDPRLRQLVKESGAAESGFIDTHAFSEKRVFRGKLVRGAEKVERLNLALLREGEKLTRQAAAAHGILEMEAYAERNGIKLKKADLYEAASVAAMRAQGNMDSAVAGTMFTGRYDWLAKTAFQFQRPAMAFFDTVITRAFKERDLKPLFRSMAYAAVLAGLYRWVTTTMFGTEHDIFQDAGITVGETPIADYMEKKVGRWTRDLVLVPGWPTNSFSEAPVTWETGKNLLESWNDSRPELAAEALSGTLWGPQVKRLRQFFSARPVGKVGEKVEEVDVPHAATVGEALTPWDKFTGQSGQRMPEQEAFWRMLLPGASTRGQEAFTMRDKLKGMAEDVQDLNIKRNQALLNMRRSLREGRKEDADVFKAEYLQLKQKTGKGSDMAGIRESEQWEKLPPEVRQLANVSRQARMQMVTEVLEDPSSPYSAATRKDIIRAMEKSETYAEGTTSEVRQRYRAARAQFLAKIPAK